MVVFRDAQLQHVANFSSITDAVLIFWFQEGVDLYLHHMILPVLEYGAPQGVLPVLRKTEEEAHKSICASRFL